MKIQVNEWMFLITKLLLGFVPSVKVSVISVWNFVLFPATKNIFQNKNHHFSTVVLHILGKQAINVM